MKRKLLIGGGLVVVIVLLLGAYGSHLAKKIIEERRHDIAGLAIDIVGYDVGLLSGDLKLTDIKIYPAGKETPEALLAGAKSLSIRVSLLDVLSGKLHAKKVKLETPVIKYVITGKKTSNWSTLTLGGAATPKKESSSEKKWMMIVDKVVIDNGDVSYLNEMNGQHLELKDVDISVDDIRPSKEAGELPTEMELEAKIGDSGGEISMNGRAALLDPAISFDIEGNISSTPVTTFSSFYAEQVPFTIAAGSIAVSSHAKAVAGALTSNHHATIAGLKAAGGMKGELMNRFLLSNTGPIGIDVAVNGDLSSGEFSVSTALSKGIVEELLKRATLSVPEMAIDEVKQLSPLKGIKHLFKKR